MRGTRIYCDFSIRPSECNFCGGELPGLRCPIDWVDVDDYG